jgi:hypothetical protein
MLTDDGAGSHVLDKGGEEGAFGEIGIVRLEEGGRGDELGETGELEAFGLETLDDLTDEAALDTVWLHHNVSSNGGLEWMGDGTYRSISAIFDLI